MCVPAPCAAKAFIDFSAPHPHAEPVPAYPYLHSECVWGWGGGRGDGGGCGCEALHASCMRRTYLDLLTKAWCVLICSPRQGLPLVGAVVCCLSAEVVLQGMHLGVDLLTGGGRLAELWADQEFLRGMLQGSRWPV